MRAALRLIYEVLPSVGSSASTRVDTAELAPPTYEDLDVNADATYTIGATADDVEIPVPDSCLVLLVSDVPVLVRLADGETQVRVRHFLVGGANSEAIALEGATLLVSGTGTPAVLRVLYLGKT